MKTTDFQHLLLRAAVVAMGADGDVAEEEKRELARVASSTAYFLGFNYNESLPLLLAEGRNHQSGAALALAQAVEEGHLKPKQEEVLMEVLLRIIEADAVVQPAERTLLRTLRQVLQLSDGTLLTRFPRLLTYLMPDTDEPLHI